jgi:hypothetical protein
MDNKRCICGWKYGKSCGVLRNQQNRHCWNIECRNSFQQIHLNGYNVNNCCNINEDEGISE